MSKFTFTFETDSLEELAQLLAVRPSTDVTAAPTTQVTVEKTVVEPVKASEPAKTEAPVKRVRRTKEELAAAKAAEEASAAPKAEDVEESVEEDEFSDLSVDEAVEEVQPSKYTKQQLNDKFVSYAKTKGKDGRQAISDLIVESGFSKFSDIPESSFDAVYALIEKKMAGKK